MSHPVYIMNTYEYRGDNLETSIIDNFSGNDDNEDHIPKYVAFCDSLWLCYPPTYCSNLRRK